MYENSNRIHCSSETKRNDIPICKPDESTELQGSFSGYASVFNIPDSYRDIVVKGAFANDLTSHIPILWQHMSE